ncbi:hypothetical protein VVD49_16895 [Uliginosibacterium sp. H3]|uniref:Uncharacterized protein n=1 Tax=Uliginosibacterium silvisoli TaxID=3114758 RepID=A0ABU6K819_9RHOO|nr:hypothetical protein [Uliginosibacterium sp. H3]
MTNHPMQLEDLLRKTCLIGLSYYDANGDLLKQSQFAGQVAKVDQEMGITVSLRHSDPDAKAAEFILPPNLDAWYKAPRGHFQHAASGVDIMNPDFLVTWSIYRTREDTAEGQHEWWDWVPNTTPPQVGGPQ